MNDIEYRPNCTEEQTNWEKREPLALKLLSLIEINAEARIYAHPTYQWKSNIEPEWVEDEVGVYLSCSGVNKIPERYDAVLFIDDNPRANWSHQCRYIFLVGDKPVIVNGQLPPIGGFNYWRIIPRKWDRESDNTKYAVQRAGQQIGKCRSGWWRVIPEREARAHVGSRGCIVYASLQKNDACNNFTSAACAALYMALESGSIQDWQDPIVQWVGEKLEGAVSL